MASNPVIPSAPISGTDKLKQILKTVTDAALFIEQLLAGAGVGGAGLSQAEALTAAFGNLAAIAIQAAHDAAGKAVTEESVLELMPVITPLAAPVAQPVATVAAAVSAGSPAPAVSPAEG